MHLSNFDGTVSNLRLCSAASRIRDRVDPALNLQADRDQHGRTAQPFALRFAMASPHHITEMSRANI